ncbi:hypothetical protein KUG47_01815 [Falsochrobactrum sp. TDYN1]|uniref:DUF2946 domain-containing protein n=1 Tax=Falsochrobactrum tianjinense TaxID=2706015 RepID=A0A949UTC7_9HYPH|nr:hypothetical protein [Falsochrobactrum sp. TDYN1]MBV2142231.1 hypothetical protein [Falsochrobactrum sp. TDYN1]
MTKSAFTRRAILAIRILSVFALVLVAFAHKPIELTPADDFQLAQYMLPDGSYPVLCVTDQSTGSHDHGQKQHLHDNRCEACRISSTFLCPLPASSTGAAPDIAMAESIVPPLPVLRRNIYPPSAPPHAPPLA